ncbi:MAG: hotdog fold thioesterase [Gammaproteobacteria bacterium]|nr:hotdog fold thioesterase [Gammaproteobacteria bacterium]
MEIWSSRPDLSALHALSYNTLVDHLGIKIIEVGDDYLKATMPVDYRTHQPMGLLHGGASVALAETLGSIGAYLCIDDSKHSCVGLEINANHLRPVRKGLVTAIATPIRLGKMVHVWEIRIYDDRDHLVCISRLTIAVIKKKVD